MLTPQAIKDQEFQVKFRGYDAIEVKAYLEILADDYFELTEQNRVQAEEIESLQLERDTLLGEKEELTAEVTAGQENVDGIQSEIDEGYKHKDQQIEQLSEQVEALEAEKAAFDALNGKNSEKIAELEELLTGDKNSSIEEQAELEKLRARSEILEEQNMELKQEGVDFKTTILAAQKFADNLRDTSKEEAAAIMHEARAEVEKFRVDSEKELSRLPKEIEALGRRKAEVREELKTVLTTYMDGLDVFPVMDLSDKDDDLSELFESIQIPDSVTTGAGDIENTK